MLFSIAIILIILGILFFALGGFFGRFPDNWEWVGIVLAGVGLAMATPSIFQMLWGRPTIKMQFENGVKEVDRFLPVYLSNPPIKNKILKKLGVRRETIQSLTAQFRISELGSGRVIIPSRQARIYSDEDPDDKGRFRTTLPPTFSVAASIMVVLWDVKKDKAIVLPDRLREVSSLPEGAYLVHIIFLVDGDPISVSRQFIIGKKADDLTWVQKE
jgi:hypothetical protein